MKPSFVRQILSGKSLGRFLFNVEISKIGSSLSGRVLDLAGGSGSYYEFFPSGIDIIRTNIAGREDIQRVDFNEKLPFDDDSFDNILFFNAIYIVENQSALMFEIRRVLKKEGKVFISSPFLQGEMKEPHDFVRLTSEGLKRLFAQAGFSTILITPYGERFSVIANLLHDFFVLSVIRLPVYTTARILDYFIPKNIRTKHPTPIGYFCVLTK